MCMAVFLGVGGTTVNKTEEDTCSQSAYILEGETGNKPRGQSLSSRDCPEENETG